MVPRKYKSLLTQVSEKTGAKESLIDNLMTFYYKEVRRTLVELEAPDIYLKNFGHFRIKNTRLGDLRKLYETRINRLDLSKFCAMKRKMDLENYLVKIDKMEEMVKAEKQRKAEQRKKRWGN